MSVSSDSLDFIPNNKREPFLKLGNGSIILIV